MNNITKKLLVLIALIGFNDLIIAEHGHGSRSSSSGRSYNRSSRDSRRGNYSGYNRSRSSNRYYNNRYHNDRYYNDGYRNRGYYNDGYYDNGGEGLALGLLTGTAIAATAAAASND